MKTRNLLGMVWLFLCAFTLAGCSDEEKEGRKITDYKEYVLTVASEKVPGVVYSCGGNYLADVYAVRKEHTLEWEALGGIADFEYEPGFEYRIRISETSYLDYDMGTPAWTEYELLEMMSVEEKDSEELPVSFVPDWFYESYCAYIHPEFKYVIDADRKEEIEADLKTEDMFLSKGLNCYVDMAGSKKWFLLDAEKKVVGCGLLEMKSKDYKEFPEIYKLLPPEGNVLGYMQWSFKEGAGSEESVMQCDVFICTKGATRDFAPEPGIVPWLYIDLTAYYQNKYPEANVRGVALCYTVKN